MSSDLVPALCCRPYWIWLCEFYMVTQFKYKNTVRFMDTSRIYQISPGLTERTQSGKDSTNPDNLYFDHRWRYPSHQKVITAKVWVSPSNWTGSDKPRGRNRPGVSGSAAPGNLKVTFSRGDPGFKHFKAVGIPFHQQFSKDPIPGV